MVSTSTSATVIKEPDPKIPRGVRNNNPGNIEYSPKWQGLKPEPRTDDRFCEFITMARGFRALAVVLCTYQDKDGITTIRDTIARWAPPSENNTSAYVDAVCKSSGFSADAKLNYHDFNDACPVIYGIALHENGNYPFKRADIVAGCELAGLENVPRGAVASTVKSVAPLAAGAASYAAENTDWLAEKFQWLQPLVANGPDFLRYGFWGAVLVIGGAIAFVEVRKFQAKK